MNLISTLLISIAAHSPGVVHFLQFSGKTWVVAEMVLPIEGLENCKRVFKFESLRFESNSVTISGTLDSKTLTKELKVRAVAVARSAVLIELLDEDDDVRLQVLCIKKGKSADFAVGLDPKSPPKGFDAIKDRIILLKSTVRK